jgi:hypothetical protein
MKNWDTVALGAVIDAASELDSFTTDDIWDRLNYVNAGYPNDNRRMGGVIRLAAKSGIITSTFAFKRSRMGINHGRPVRIWRSAL